MFWIPTNEFDGTGFWDYYSSSQNMAGLGLVGGKSYGTEWATIDNFL
jgi:hypothetical protein